MIRKWWKVYLCIALAGAVFWFGAWAIAGDITYKVDGQPVSRTATAAIISAPWMIGVIKIGTVLGGIAELLGRAWAEASKP